jgi:predicted DNA-binding transcriptional regulator
MNRDRVVGVIILVMSVLILLVYSWFLIVSPMIVLQITAFAAVGAVLVVAAWIGWTMATTPPPAPLEAEPIASLTSERTETVGQ